MEGMEAEGGRTLMFGLYLMCLRLSAVGKGTVFMSLRYANLAWMGSHTPTHLPPAPTHTPTTTRRLTQMFPCPV